MNVYARPASQALGVDHEADNRRLKHQLARMTVKLPRELGAIQPSQTGRCSGSGHAGYAGRNRSFHKLGHLDRPALRPRRSKSRRAQKA